VSPPFLEDLTKSMKLSGSHSPKVHFVIVGAAKCGTTSLAFYLSQHPRICFSSVKEPHFFSKSTSWKDELDNYHSLFDQQEGQLCGEASTSYTFYPQYSATAQRLFEYNPETRIIYLMRDPVERMISQYMHEYLHGKISNTLKHELIANPVYVNRSRYAVQIRRYLEYFRRDQILLLTSEGLITSARQSVETVLAFIGLDDGLLNLDLDLSRRNVSTNRKVLKGVPKALRKAFGPARQAVSLRSVKSLLTPLLYRRIPEKPEIEPAFRRELWRLVEDDVSGIEQLMGRPLPEWRDKALSGYNDSQPLDQG
jgi:hypothetical protein